MIRRRVEVSVVVTTSSGNAGHPVNGSLNKLSPHQRVRAILVGIVKRLKVW